MRINNYDLTHNWITDNSYDQTYNKYFTCTNCNISKQIKGLKTFYFNYFEGNKSSNLRSLKPCNEMIIENILK